LSKEFLVSDEKKSTRKNLLCEKLKSFIHWIFFVFCFFIYFGCSPEASSVPRVPSFSIARSLYTSFTHNASSHAILIIKTSKPPTLSTIPTGTQ